jgi:FkbM family methyltransferase
MFITPHHICRTEESIKYAKEMFLKLGITDLCFIPIGFSKTLITLYKLDRKKCLDTIKLFRDRLSIYHYYDFIRFKFTGLPIRCPYFEDTQQYIVNDLYELNEQDVIVDCGAYTGDSVKLYCDAYPDLKKIIAFEPVADNYKCLVETISQMTVPVIPIQKAVGDDNYETYISGHNGTSVSILKHDENITEKITVCCLDDEIGNERPTLIKFDVEGFELPALKGAAKLIKKKHPILVISLYHLIEDLWTIPEYVLNLYPDYHLFIRKYTSTPWELILYAVPPNRLIEMPDYAACNDPKDYNAKSNKD